MTWLLWAAIAALYIRSRLIERVVRGDLAYALDRLYEAREVLWSTPETRAQFERIQKIWDATRDGTKK